VDEVIFNFEEEDYVFCALPVGMLVEDSSECYKDQSFIFVRRIVNGKIQLMGYGLRVLDPFNAGTVDPNTGTVYSSHKKIDIIKHFFLKDGECIYRQPGFFSRKELSALFEEDCSELSEKIKTTKYKAENLPEIVQFYNTHCGNN
jgi:hypothetical protein